MCLDNFHEHFTQDIYYNYESKTLFQLSFNDTIAGIERNLIIGQTESNLSLSSSMNCPLYYLLLNS